MSGRIDTSIIVCSYNRAVVLRETLEYLLALTPLPGCEFEVLLVDNNSTDATQEVARRVRAEHPRGERLSIHHEPLQGLSFARNHGIRKARGELLVFVDDDIVVRDPWLGQYQGAFHARRDVDAFAGKVVPRFQAPRPAWLSNDLLGVLAVVDHGGFERMLDAEHLPMGANMGFRRSCFERFGLFRTDLGRRGSSLASNEDDEFFRRLFERGGRLLYLPDAQVEHVIPPERLTKAYFRRWKFATGRSTARSRVDDDAKQWLGVPRYMLRNLVECAVSTVWRLLLLDPDRAFQRELRVRYLFGFLWQRVLARRSGARPVEHLEHAPSRAVAATARRSRGGARSGTRS